MSVGFAGIKKSLSPFLGGAIEDALLVKIEQGTLDSLSLIKLPVTDTDLDVMLPYCPNLTYLNLSQCTVITDEGIRIISGLFRHKLKELHLQSLPNLTPDSLNELSTMTSLEVLDLSKNIFPLNNLYKLEALKDLKKLWLWNCVVLKDVDLEWLKNKHLSHLDVSYCKQLTDTCLKYFKKIEKIDLDGLNYITQNGVDDLISSYENINISIVNCNLLSLRSRL